MKSYRQVGILCKAVTFLSYTRYFLKFSHFTLIYLLGSASHYCNPITI
jgi:hypothetical protein